MQITCRIIDNNLHVKCLIKKSISDNIHRKQLKGKVLIMIPSKREYNYVKEHFNEVHHTTVNPEGPGVVRVHLVPPKYSEKDIGSSLAIINGHDIVPVYFIESVLARITSPSRRLLPARSFTVSEYNSSPS